MFAPINPLWAFTVGNLGQYLFNNTAGAFIDFELDISEQTNVIIRILKYCGVIINNPQVVAMANSEIQQSNLNLKS